MTTVGNQPRVIAQRSTSRASAARRCSKVSTAGGGDVPSAPGQLARSVPPRAAASALHLSATSRRSVGSPQSIIAGLRRWRSPSSSPSHQCMPSPDASNDMGPGCVPAPAYVQIGTPLPPSAIARRSDLAGRLGRAIEPAATRSSWDSALMKPSRSHMDHPGRLRRGVTALIAALLGPAVKRSASGCENRPGARPARDGLQRRQFGQLHLMAASRNTTSAGATNVAALTDSRRVGFPASSALNTRKNWCQRVRK